MNNAQVCLRQLGVSHPAVEKLIQAANQSGALGSKLTGGGLGGCVISLSPDAQAAENVSVQLLKLEQYHGWKIIKLNFSFEDNRQEAWLCARTYQHCAN